jgi:hypothetical protein
MELNIELFKNLPGDLWSRINIFRSQMRIAEYFNQGFIKEKRKRIKFNLHYLNLPQVVVVYFRAFDRYDRIYEVLYEIIDYMDKSKSSKDIVLEKEFSGGFYDLSSDIYYSITNVTGSRDLYYYMLGNDIKSIIVVYSGENINVTDVYNLFESEFIFDNLNFNGKLIFDINRFLSIDENDYIRYLIRKFNKKVY